MADVPARRERPCNDRSPVTEADPGAPACLLGDWGPGRRLRGWIPAASRGGGLRCRMGRGVHVKRPAQASALPDVLGLQMSG